MEIVGALVMHDCDNPACCNPEHFVVGTNDENMADMAAKGRAARRTQRGELNAGAKITEDDVRAIRADKRPNVRVAPDFGISHSMVSAIRLRKAWAHVD